MNTHEFQILLTSDVHGFVFPTLYGDNQNAPLGLAKAATIIQQQRQLKPTLLIENGDFIQGSPLTYFHATFEANTPNPMIALGNQLQYDAAVLGNHEFNYGEAYLQQAMDQADYPYLTASITTKDNEPLRQPYQIIEKAGLRIGVLGLTTQYIPVWENPAHIEGLTFHSAVETAKKWVPYIREHEAVDCLVVAYHGGFENDLKSGAVLETTGENEGYALCMEVPGIDILLTGHQHRVLAEQVNGVSIVQPGAKGQFVGQVTVNITTDDAGQVQNITHTPELLPITEDIKADEQLLASLKELDQRLQHWLDQPLGTIEGNLQFEDAFEARLHKHAYVEWINAVQMEATGAPISCTSIFQNGPGGLPQQVTMRDIITNYIFPNTLVVLEIPGDALKAAIEQSASYFTLNEEGQPEVAQAFLYPKEEPYNYDMWDGVDFEVDLHEPVGQRVKHLTFQGQAIQPDQMYPVVMNNYRATGAGNFEMFLNCKKIADPQIDMTEVLANYFMKHPVVKAQRTENWKFIY